MRTEPIRVTHVLEATVGGTKRHLLDLALNLDRQRFIQHAILSRERDPASADDMIARLREGGIEVTIVPMVRGISPFSDLRALRQLAAILKAWQPDIIHGHSSKAGFLTRLVASPARRVYTPHSFAFQMGVGPLRRAVYRALERWAGRRTDVLIALCDSEKQLAVDSRIIAADRVQVIENGVALPAVSPLAFPAPPGGPIIGTVGALTAQKDTRTLIRALPLIREAFPAASLIIAGQGVLREQLHSEIIKLGLENAVSLLGQRQDIPAILAALDAFVLPSRWEGFPYALLEAMAAGIPCAGSAVPGIVDLITDGETGRLFAAQSPAALAGAVIALLSDTDGARAMAAAARARVFERNTIERMVARTASVYEGMLQ